MPGMLGMQDASGSGQRVERKLWPAQSRNTAVPPFWVYDASTTSGGVTTYKVKVTGGYMLYPFTDLIVDVADSAAITVTSADYIWLQRDGNSTWSFGHGATAPADKMTINLANIIIAGSPSVMTIDRTWDGGDINLPITYPVTLTKTGGTAGDGSNYCSFTYSVLLMDGTTIMTAASPQNSRARGMRCYAVAGMKGSAYFDNTGSFVLWDCDEKQDQCEGTCNE